MKDLFNSEQLEALRHHFPNISKAMEEGTPVSATDTDDETDDNNNVKTNIKANVLFKCFIFI